MDVKIVVMGGGSTGLVYGSKLSQVCDTQILVRREEQAISINADGTKLERPDGIEEFHPTATTDVSILKQADLAIGLTKCGDAISIAEIFAENSKPGSAFLCLHNGLGTLDLYNKVIGQENVIGGVTYLGANRLNDTTAKLGVSVRTVIGEQSGEESERLLEIAKIFSDAGFKTETSKSVQNLIWDKLVLAVGQHALCAITGLSFKQIRDSDNLLAISQELLNETQAVASTQGINFEDSLMDRVIANLEFGSDHYSSMYQDLKAGRTTEIDFINGAISELGKQNSIPTPVNDTITDLVHALETKNEGNSTQRK